MAEKTEQEKLIEDIRSQLAAGDELRDVARRNGMSCRMVCKLVAKPPEEESIEDDYGFASPLKFD